MVSAAQVKASNALLSSAQVSSSALQNGLTFVFAGATAGIGLSTLKAFARRTADPGAPKATAYIIGRSRERFQPHLDELKLINPRGKWMFLEGQFTLLKEGKRLADEIVRLESESDRGGKIDALVTSTGFLTFNGAREDTLEGLDADIALIYYNRLLLTTLLLPILSRAPSPRVVTVFSAGNEAPFTPEQVSSEFRDGFTRLGSTLALATLTTLSFEQLAAKYPNVAFIHSYPGGVQTDILDKLMDTAKGIWSYPAWFVKKFVNPVFWLISKPFTVSVEESGERHLFLATSAAYPAASIASGQIEGNHGGVVPLVEGVERKSGSVELEGRSNGVYRTQSTCEVAGSNRFLSQARKEGLDVLGWRETVKVFERVLGEGVVRGV